MQSRLWEPSAPNATSPRHVLTGGLLALLLHGVVLAALILFYRCAVHPSGGGGGPGRGSGTGVAFVDLSGLGTGWPVSGTVAPAPTAGDTQTPEEPTASCGQEQDRTPPDPPQQAAAQEKAVPVLAPLARLAPEAGSLHRQRPPRRPVASPPQEKTVAPGPVATMQTTGRGTGGPAGGEPGPGNGLDGGGAGTGGGTGGGEGTGMGPGVGAGRGIGEDGGMRLSAVDVKPRIASQVEPDYPEGARRQGLHGRVVARFLVTAEGHVSRLSIVSAEPPRVFDRAVLAALEKWRFHPASFQGRAVAAWVMLPIRFDLAK